MDAIIKFDNVSKIFDTKDVALKDVSFEVAKGEFICLIGPSGEGKSTVLQLIAGLESTTTGAITKPDNVSMVFQAGALLPWLTVLDNVGIGLAAERLTVARVRSESEKYIAMMGLAGYENKYPRELSGGQRQRVGIARALAMNPEVLLLDEPFSALDPVITEELHKDIMKIWEATKKTIVMVSHSIDEAVTLADRILVVKNHTIDRTFSISLPHPRRENEIGFAHEVQQVRREFFK